MKLLKAISEVLVKAIEIVTSIMVATTVLVIAAGVFVRYVLDGSLPYVFELSSLLYAYIIFWGLSVALKERAMIGVDVLTNVLSTAWQKVFTIMVFIIIIVISFVMMQGGFDLASKTNMKLISMGISQKYLYLTLPIGFLMLGINATIQLIQILWNRNEANV